MMITEPLMTGPCGAELDTPDVAGAAAFYGGLLGWRTEVDPRPEAGGHAIARLDGDRVAGIGPVTRPDQPAAWTMTLAVADADATVRAIREAGGSVTMEPADILDLGRYAVVADPSGAVFALWQPRASPGAERMYEPGTMCWAELATRDIPGAKEFYSSVFGWEMKTISHPGQQYTQLTAGGQLFGGMLEIDEMFPPGIAPYWGVYFEVPDVDAAVAAAEETGGRSVFSAMDVPDVGRIAGLADPQGAHFSVYAEPGS